MNAVDVSILFALLALAAAIRAVVLLCDARKAQEAMSKRLDALSDSVEPILHKEGATIESRVERIARRAWSDHYSGLDYQSSARVTELIRAGIRRALEEAEREKKP